MGNQKKKDDVKAKKCEIVQQISFIENLEHSLKALERPCVKEWAYIIHDKDVHEDGTPKAPHIHIFLQFTDTQAFSYVSGWFGFPPNCVNKIKAPRFQGALPYLTHRNTPEKYQYDASEVKASFDYVKFLREWEENNRRNKKEQEIEDIISRITTGEIRAFNYYKFIDGVTYASNRKKFDNAFKYYNDMRKGEDRNMECIFITGGSGTGKTTFAKEMAQKCGYSMYVSSGSNDVLDDYAGQDCLILDDLRPSCLGMSDLLKMLDNHTSSTVRSRFYNKAIYCKLVIITTVIPLEEFFRNVFERESEPIVQLKRRCQIYYKFTEDMVRIYEYDSVKQDYVYIHSMKNPIQKKYQKKEINIEEAKKKSEDKLKQLFGDIEFVDEVIEEEVKVEPIKMVFVDEILPDED